MNIEGNNTGYSVRDVAMIHIIPKRLAQIVI